tara:strand:- start:6357 stop:6770 length:414 start_codon:yes stop_codon:yes gene_type:complete
MFSKEQLEGVLLTTARPEVTAYRSQSKTGWTIRTRIMFRAKSDFLIALQRKFEQLEINSILRQIEGVNRKAPVLIVGKQESINNLRNLMPKHTPCSHSSWELFDEVLVKMETKEHLEDDGMKRLIELITNERDDKKV